MMRDSGIRAKQVDPTHSATSRGMNGVTRSLIRAVLLLNGTEIGDELPALSFGKSGPGGHAVAEVSLAEKPLKVAVCGGLDAFAAKGGFLVTVSHGVGLVTLLAVFLVEQCAGGDRFRPVGEWIGASVILGGNLDPAWSGCGAKRSAALMNEAEEYPGCATDHRVPPLWLRNQVPICGSSLAQPMR